MNNLDKLKNIYDEGLALLETKYTPTGFTISPTMVNLSKFEKWRFKTLNLLNNIYVDEKRLKAFDTEITSNEYRKALKGVSIIESIIEDVEEGNLDIYTISKEDLDQTLFLEEALNNFHRVVRQLRNRHEGRTTLEIKDEYDVQDLLHSLLLIHFEDVRPEEYTPSYAGATSRMDFLIKDINTVIETKMTRETLKDKQIGEQLIIDIEKYAKHPDCDKLYCFVYDPKELINNPKGLEKDLSDNSGEIDVKTIIVPKY